MANERRVIRTMGTARVSSKPDQAVLSVSVKTEAPTALMACEMNAERSREVIRNMKRLVGGDGEVKTDRFSVDAKYSYPKKGSRTIDGFETTNTVIVTVNNLAILETIIDAAVKAGANDMDGPHFGIKHNEALKLEALQLAAKKARACAEAIAKGLGAKIGNVVMAHEGEVERTYRHVLSPDADMPVGSAAPPIEVGDLDVGASVTLEVELVYE